jgi:hypothetical protein
MSGMSCHTEEAEDKENLFYGGIMSFDQAVEQLTVPPGL